LRFADSARRRSQTHENRVSIYSPRAMGLAKPGNRPLCDTEQEVIREAPFRTRAYCALPAQGSCIARFDLCGLLGRQSHALSSCMAIANQAKPLPLDRALRGELDAGRRRCGERNRTQRSVVCAIAQRITWKQRVVQHRACHRKGQESRPAPRCARRRDRSIK